jgi:hypothetical protein
MITERLSMPVIAAALALAAAIVAASEATGDYATDLGRVYGGYQRMLAMKEACDAAVPSARTANEKAFTAWQARHRALIQDLQRRVTAMIRLASKDQQEYARNLGKYEGEIFQERQEYKDILLALGPDELREQCQRVPEMLKGSGADLGKVYAAELETVRKRK